jgi:cyclopropane fatty-acyl-phospholipid synthase-like methyltransferase
VSAKELEAWESMDEQQAGEPQYRDAIALIRSLGPQRMGLMSAWSYYDDPKRLAFTLARYKFVAKMIEGSESVLEVGCGDGFASRIVAQSVKRLKGVDFDPEFVASAREIVSPRWPIEFAQHDMLAGAVPGSFDAIYSLDVLEHIRVEDEDRFLANMIAPLAPHGTVVIGMPSLQSQAHASAHSKIGHVNCKDQRDFKRMMLRYFRNVFMFSMNDEVVHTGYHAMAHYNLALACGKKD